MAAVDESALPQSCGLRLMLNLSTALSTGDAYTGVSLIDYFVDAPGCSELVFHADAGSVSIDSLKVASGKKQLKIQSSTRFTGGRSTGVAGADLVGPVSDGDVVLVRLAQDLGIGQVTVEVKFTAKVRGDAVGIYSCVPKQGSSYCLATHFEVTEARKAFPCVDDTYVRVPLTLSLTVPKACNLVLGNAEVESQTASGAAATTYTFEATRALPAYVFGFAVGQLSPGKQLKRDTVTVQRSPRAATDAGELVIEVIAVGDRAASSFDTQLALTYAKTSYTAFLAEFFGPSCSDACRDDPDSFASAYGIPHATLRFVALPVMKISGMENDGIVFLQGSLGEIAAKAAGKPRAQAQEALARFVAHEIAHHWMGNAVGLPFGTKEGVCLLMEAWGAGKALGRVIGGPPPPPSGKGKAAAAATTQQQQPSSSPDTKAHEAEGGKELTDRTYQEAEAAMAAFVATIGWDAFARGVSSLVENSAGAFVESDDFHAACAP